MRVKRAKPPEVPRTGEITTARRDVPASPARAVPEDRFEAASPTRAPAEAPHPAVPLDFAQATVVSVSPGSADDPSIKILGTTTTRPWQFSGSAVADATRRTITIVLDGQRPATEPGEQQPAAFFLSVPVAAPAAAGPWKVSVTAGGRELGTCVWPEPQRPASPTPPANPVTPSRPGNPARGKPDPTRTPFEKEDGTGGLIVWARSNFAESQGATIRVGLPGEIVADEQGLHTARVHVSGMTKPLTAEGHAPFKEGAVTTDDAFDQVQVLWTANWALARLRAAGLDLDELLRGGPNDGVLRVQVNTSNSGAYVESENTIQLGTNMGRWHAAADGEVLVHEIGHFAVARLNPWMAGEGLAIGEGTADAVQALMFGDPKNGEDAVRFLGDLMPASWRDSGYVRSADNDFVLTPEYKDPHDRGLAYSGLIWSTKGALARILGDDPRASELMLAVATKHGLFYTGSGNLRPEDFLAAMIRSARVQLAGKLDAAQLSGFEQTMIEEGTRRGLCAPGWSPPGEERRGVAAALAALDPQAEASALANALKRCLDPDDVRRLDFVAHSDVGVDGLRKIVFEVRQRPGSQWTLPAEERFLSVITDGHGVRDAGGETLLRR